jgi:ABC-type protease/lipase transport system fused ATPase/permease subunit
VTHRATLTQHVDTLMVLEAGRVLHVGTPDEVSRAMQLAAAPAAAPRASGATP